MASIEVIKTEKMMQNKVRLLIEVRTSVGRATFPVDIPDQGSAAENELAAFREVDILLSESLLLFGSISTRCVNNKSFISRRINSRVDVHVHSYGHK